MDHDNWPREMTKKQKRWMIAGFVLLGAGLIVWFSLTLHGAYAHDNEVFVDSMPYFNGVNRTVDPINGRDPIDSSGYDTSTPIDLVDPDATEETKSLFVYLRDSAPDYLLFGHQNDMHHSITQGSDVYNAVNAYPAIIGIDTLSLSGQESTFD